MVGVYDNERGYRWYPTVAAFLVNELTSESRGKWFYAHAGGLADLQFVFHEIIGGRGYKIDGRFSGSSCIIAKIKKGKNCWTFIDSLWLMRESLDEIGKWIGIEKGEAERRATEEDAREFYANCSMDDLIRYNERDCVLLHQAIDAMQETLHEYGGQLQMTLASSAMNLFRRKYLSRDIETSGFVNDIIRESYYASRVEVFCRYVDEAFYHDINSSFPFAMTSPCPGEFIGTSDDIPDYGIYFADVDIEVPESYLPTTPKRVAGRIFFPVGRWRSWLSGIDIELLLNEEGKIHRVHEVFQFAPFTDLADYARDIYQQRKKEKDGFKKVALKLLMNTLYGKFAECSFKSCLMIDPDPSQIDYEKDEMVLPGIWLKEKEVPIPHMHVPIASHITAIARRNLYTPMSICNQVNYCDTDGFSSDQRFSISNELGGLKLEKKEQDSTYLACKLYWQQGEVLNKEGEWVDIASESKSEGVKAKGFSRPSINRFKALMEGREIEAVRMRRIKELLRRGDSTPVEEVIRKSINLADMLPKRFTYPDGHTRPWHVKELEGL